MKFTKKELDFLKTFQACAESSDEKLTIISNKELAKVFFVFSNDSITLIEEKELQVDEDYNLSIILSQFTKMLGFCGDTEEIEITNGKVSFGSKSEYKFETFDFNMDNFRDILKLPLDGTVTELKEISKIDKVIFSIGTLPEISCIALQDNYFVTFNDNILSMTKTNNNIDYNFYLPKSFYRLYQIYKFDTMSLTKLDKYFYMTIGSLKAYLYVPEYAIPYVFDEVVKTKYDHKTGISVDRNTFKLALSRMKVLNQQTSFNRVFMHVGDSDIKLEIKDDYIGYENINLNSMDEELKDTDLVYNTNFFFDILDNCTLDVVDIKMSNDNNTTAIKIQDVDTTFVLILYKKYE